jgi:peptidoglycan hydrolase-like protein with peptidoglycan-binding domain
VRRVLRLGAALAIVAAVVGAGWWAATSGVIAGSPADSADPADDGDAAAAGATAPVERRTLTVTETLDGTLGYAAEYEIPGGLPGTLTWIVPVGSVVGAGEPLYEVDGARKASVMIGTRPAWRTLESGVGNGYDVLQLEQNLHDLGYTRSGDEIDRHWDSDTTAAVKRWERDHGQKADGVVQLGEVVFLPEPIRVTEVTATLGGPVGGGGPLLSATSSRRVVSVDLDATERDLVETGMSVQVELPDGSTTAGTVADIGRVAESSSDGQGGTTTTLPVTITLADPAAGADLDTAPVNVDVVTDSRENVLAVPVSALLALIEGGYAVEVVDGVGAAAASPGPSASSGLSAASSVSPSGAEPTTHLVRVEPGLYADGYVEVTSNGLEAGDLVVVPS